MLFLDNTAAASRDLRARATSELDAITDIIEYQVNKELSNVRILDIFIVESIEEFGEIDEERLNMYALYIFDSSEYIDSISISPNGIIEYIVPLAGNEMMIGYNLLLEEKRNEFVERSINLRSDVAQGPVMTIQGKQIVFNRLPIFVQVNGEDEFWGIVSIALDFEKLIKKLEVDMSYNLFDYMIYVPAVDGFTDFTWGDNSILEKDYISETINLPHLTWQMNIYPKRGWNQSAYRELSYLFIGIIVSLFVFMFKRRRLIRHLEVEQQAVTDSLTGCRNRLDFDKMVENQTVLEKNSALMILDLDDFKLVNDLLGHKTGDFILKEVVSLIESGVRDTDHVYRIGGDEFVVILKKVTHLNEVEIIAQRLIDTTCREVVIDNNKINISFTLGVAISKDNHTTVEELYKRADINLYTAKNQGKRKFIID